MNGTSSVERPAALFDRETEWKDLTLQPRVRCEGDARLRRGDEHQGRPGEGGTPRPAGAGGAPHVVACGPLDALRLGPPMIVAIVPHLADYRAAGLLDAAIW
jgi:hypothetical protein